jgi:hypothetical protein
VFNIAIAVSFRIASLRFKYSTIIGGYCQPVSAG